MLRKVFLFPESNYLCEKWWHRLSVVIFYFCLAFILVFTIKILILDPYSSCITVKYFDFIKPSDLSCGTSAYSYAYSTYADESITNIFSGSVLISIALYIAAIFPSLLYRMFLFICKGANWKDSTNVT